MLSSSPDAFDLIIDCGFGGETARMVILLESLYFLTGACAFVALAYWVRAGRSHSQVAPRLLRRARYWAAGAAAGGIAAAVLYWALTPY